MALHKHKPYKHMNALRENKHEKYTICETLRQCWQKVDALSESLGLDENNTDLKELRLNIRIAVTMAKKMAKKLREHKDWNADRDFDNTNEVLNSIKKSLGDVELDEES